MTGASRIIAFGGSGKDNAATDDLPFAGTGEPEPGGSYATDVLELTDMVEGGAEADELPRLSLIRWFFPFAAILAAAGWTAFFVWAHLPKLGATTAPATWASLMTDWSMPLLLICALWLVVMRHSTREAERFGDAARLLSDESQRLETRLVTVNRELSLAREFLASETRDLEALGRIASERLSQNAERLQELVRDNGTRVETIGSVSEAALENMEKLRGQLPVIASSAKDVTNNIGNAGRTAQAQLEEMVKGFARVDEFGKACESQVLSLGGIVDGTLARLARECSELEQFVTVRFAEIEQRGGEFDEQLEKREIDALAAIRGRAGALADELEVVRAQLIGDEESCLEALRSKLSALREEGGEISRSMRESEAQAISVWQAHLEQLDRDRDALFARLEKSESEALDGAKARLESISREAGLIEEGIAERSANLIQALAGRREQVEAEQREAAARLEAMLAGIDTQFAQSSQTLRSRSAEIAHELEAIAARLLQSDERLEQISARAGESEARIAANLREIAETAASAQSSLASTEAQVTDLTESSVRLLELIRASGELSREELPQILSDSEAGLAEAEATARGIRDALKQAGKNGEWLSNQIEGSSIALNAILETITKMQFALRDQANMQKETLASLARSLTAIEEQSDRLSAKARAELGQAIAMLGNSARDVVASIGEDSAAEIVAISERLASASAEAIEKTMNEVASEATGRVEQVAAHAAGVGREATVQLRDQLAKVNELVGNLEQRIVRARERAEEQVDNDFARRAALITEALNSNAIDIAKALSTEVSDTAWEGYLRGDRGIFTRRAVSLIEAGDARAILQVFERDSDFREHVSRYIHDFEAILRQVLSARDGHALGVTLLSSDMGKLYVALAQSIERLRT